MARVLCRCGESLTVTAASSDRLTCPRCGAKIRIRRAPSSARPSVPPAAAAGDGYVRFYCPCGRRLKVQVSDRPDAGRCPECGRVVPVPESAWSAAMPPEPETHGPTNQAGARTDDLDAADLERLQRWAVRRQARQNHGEPTVRFEESTASHHELGIGASLNAAPPSPYAQMEAGLRVCPRCRSPLHLSATVCRSCGEPTPRR